MRQQSHRVDEWAAMAAIITTAAMTKATTKMATATKTKTIVAVVARNPWSLGERPGAKKHEDGDPTWPPGAAAKATIIIATATRNPWSATLLVAGHHWTRRPRPLNWPILERTASTHWSCCGTGNRNGTSSTNTRDGATSIWRKMEERRPGRPAGCCSRTGSISTTPLRRSSNGPPFPATWPWTRPISTGCPWRNRGDWTNDTMERK